MSMPIIWLIVAIAFLIGEAFTISLVSIWFAGGAAVTLVAALLGAPVWLQIILFAVTSGVVLYLSRDLAQKYINNRHQRTNADRVVGMEGLVIEAIDNDRARGQIRVAGQVWTARGAREGVIEQDAQVMVVAIEGVKAMVVRKRVAPPPSTAPAGSGAKEERPEVTAAAPQDVIALSGPVAETPVQEAEERAQEE